MRLQWIFVFMVHVSTLIVDVLATVFKPNMLKIMCPWTLWPSGCRGNVSQILLTTKTEGPVFVVSGTQKIYVKTWGCSHNNSDSEYMAGQLAAYGYQIVGTEDMSI